MRCLRFNWSRCIYAMLIFLLIGLFTQVPAFAIYPLSDDSYTQGKGVFQLELSYQYMYDKYAKMSDDPKELYESELAGQSVYGKKNVRVDSNLGVVGLTYGIIDPLDLTITIPYMNVYNQEKLLFYTGSLQGFTMKENELVGGLSDITVEFKWKFWGNDTVSFALRPGFILPTGNFQQGLGAGKFGAYGFFITSLDFDRVLLHLNLGYQRNENRLNEREDLWLGSLGGEFILVKDYFRMVTIIGLERNREKNSKIQDAYVVGGFVGSPTQSCDLGIAVKYSIETPYWESPGQDLSIFAGASIWFGWVPRTSEEPGEKFKIEKKDGE
jgi:hypothetical protein